ncbi:rho guanine nucleotide exchange factor 28 [Brachyhypopomus gauderio]|uniref:rho guanine nucleotide exchange factor 28 n=1 Tax=Brachyhypopomus gauderio TaxID=698409 RepID=UPI004043152D
MERLIVANASSPSFSCTGPPVRCILRTESGQTRVFALLPSVMEAEEVFVVVEGSSLLHVLPTKLHSIVYFIAPGHNQPETVCVKAYIHMEGVVKYVGMSFLTYVEDAAQELAEYLVTHSNCLSTTEYRDLIRQYGLSDSSTRIQMDHSVTLALANLQTPYDLLSKPAQESLLHLCVRLGFVHVLEFLLCQPGALMVINSPNQEGDTPLELAWQTNQHDILRLLTHPPNPLATPLAGLSQVWIDRSHLLKYTHSFGVMSLSVCVSDCAYSIQHIQSTILVLRDCLRDSSLLRKIEELCASRGNRPDQDTLETSLDEPHDSTRDVVPYSVSGNMDVLGLVSSFLSFISEFQGMTHSSADEDEELLLSINSGGSDSQSNLTVSSPTGFSEILETHVGDTLAGEEQELCSETDSPSSSQPGMLVYSATEFSPLGHKETIIINEINEREAENPSERLGLLRRQLVNTKIQNKVYHTTLREECQQCTNSTHKTCGDMAPVYCKVPLKTTSCSILRCSSSHSSPALLVSSHNNFGPHRRRSNSEGCGQLIAMRKTWSLIGDTSRTSRLAQSSVPAPLDYSADSWRVVVDTQFADTLDTQEVKRQEVIYELMQTEFHHVQTLTVMIEVLRRGLLEEVQLEEDVIGQIFPSLDELIKVHRNFLTAMEIRQQDSTTSESRRNYVIQRIGDVLLQQFSGRLGAQLTELYGDFCSRHSEALKVYKQLQQSNRKLQLFLRQQRSNSVIKRREIPEFLLLITQRITKYPVLLERLLLLSEDGSVEHYEIATALDGLRGVLAGVELHVSEFQQAQRLEDVISRLDAKSFTKMKSGEIFNKQILQNTPQTLTYDSTLTCRTTSGRLRDVFALLLTDILVFLQEKEQKFTFAALEQKPSVVPLQALIVREIANQERGLFLISSDSGSGPEMYEIHTATREERDVWLTLLQQAAESPDNEMKSNEELKIKKIHMIQDALFSLDLQVCTALDEKLQLYLKMGGLTPPPCHLLVQPHPYNRVQASALLVQPHPYNRAQASALLVQPHPYNRAQASALLRVAQEEVVKLAGVLMPWLSCNHDIFIQEAEELNMSKKYLLKRTQPVTLAPAIPTNQIRLKVVKIVQSLAQMLYSLQAAVTILDSLFEVQKLLIQDEEALPQWFVSDYGDVKTSAECHVEGGPSCRPYADRQREVEQKEKEHTEEMERLRAAMEDLEAEQQEFQESLDVLRDEEARVARERKTLQEEERRVRGERERLESRRGLAQRNSTRRQRSLSVATALEK